MNLHDLYDGDEPKIDLNRELAEAIAERTEEMRTRANNVYGCKVCGGKLRTHNEHVGITPAVIPFCTTDDDCPGEMTSAGSPVPWPDWADQLPVGATWHRPSTVQLAEFDPEARSYVVDRGGLVLKLAESP